MENKNVSNFYSRTNIVRLLFFLTGLIILGLGISILVTSNFGVGPWDLVYIGLSNKLGLSLGICMNIAAIFHIILGGVITKKRPQFLSLITSMIVGIFVDFWMLFFKNIVIDSLIIQFLFFITSLLIISLGASLYIKPRFPVSPLDYLMVCLIDKFNLSLSRSKIICEGIGFTLGLILGGPVGLGTIIILVSIGPLMQSLQKTVDNLYEYLTTSVKSNLT